MDTNEILAAIATMTPHDTAIVARAAIAQGGTHGRDFGVELGKLLDDADADFDEGAQWVQDCVEGNAPA